VSFLTTGLDYLVVGDYLVRKRAASWDEQMAMKVSLPPYVRLSLTKGFIDPERMAATCEVRTSYDSRACAPLSSDLCNLLMNLDGEKSIRELFRINHIKSEENLVQEMMGLWSQRLIKLRPDAEGR
jgi:carbamoyltransferase